MVTSIRKADPLTVEVSAPEFSPGVYALTAWNTAEGCVMERRELVHNSGPLRFTPPPFRTDLALAIRPAGARS